MIHGVVFVTMFSLHHSVYLNIFSSPPLRNPVLQVQGVTMIHLNFLFPLQTVQLQSLHTSKEFGTFFLTSTAANLFHNLKVYIALYPRIYTRNTNCSSFYSVPFHILILMSNEIMEHGRTYFIREEIGFFLTVLLFIDYTTLTSLFSVCRNWIS